MSFIDVLIVVVYMTGLIIFGYFIGRNNEDQDDFFLAKRQLPWFAVGLSVAATMLSANSFIGGPGWSYQTNLSPFMVNISVPLALFIVMFTMIPIYYFLKVTSIYEYIELRLGKKTRILSVIGFILNSTIQVGSFVFVPALIIQAFTGWSMVPIVIGIVFVSVVYTILGGIKSVIWTDTIQMLLMWGGLFFILVTILNESGLSFFETMSQARDAGKLESFTMDFNFKAGDTFWIAILGGTAMWIRYFGFDQGQVQRVLTSKSMKDVKTSYVLSSISMNIVYFLCLIIGVMLFVFYGGKEFESGNMIMISFIKDYIPVGVIGIIVAAVFSAAMSSIDSLLNSLTTVFVKDIYEPYIVKTEVETTIQKTMIIASIAGVIVTIFTIFGFVGTTKSVLDTVGSYVSFISGPMLGIIILAMFTNRANDNGVFIGAILGFVTVYLFGSKLDFHWLINPFVGGVSTFIYGYILSLMFQNVSEDNSKYNLYNIKKDIESTENIDENGVSTVPLKIDKYGYILLGFFVLQFVVLVLI